MRKTDIYFWHWDDPKKRNSDVSQLESRGKIFLVEIMQPHDVGLVLCPQTKTNLELWSQIDRPWQTEQADFKPTLLSSVKLQPLWDEDLSSNPRLHLPAVTWDKWCLWQAFPHTQNGHNNYNYIFCMVSVKIIWGTRCKHDLMHLKRFIHANSFLGAFRRNSVAEARAT